MIKRGVLAVLVAAMLAAGVVLFYARLTRNAPGKQPARPADTTSRPASSIAAPSPVRIVSCSGHVFTSRGEAIPGAQIVVWGSDNGEVLQKALSDSAGAYELREFTSDSVLSIACSAEGYAESEQRIEVVTCPVNFFLMPLGSISGIVQSDAAKPLSEFVVFAEAEDGYRTHSLPTEANGLFLLKGFEAGSVNLKVTYAPASKQGRGKLGSLFADILPSPIQLNKGEQREGVVITLPWDTDSFIGGIVVDNVGAPILATEVSAIASSGILLSLTQTDVQGMFRLENLSNPELQPEIDEHGVTLFAERTGYVGDKRVGVKVGAEDLVFTLNQRGSGEIRGVVLDKFSRAPIPDAQVCLLTNYLSVGGIERPSFTRLRENANKGKLRVNRKGEFKIPDITEGDISLMTYAPDYGVAITQGISVRARQANFVEILLAPAGLLRVHVNYTGQMEGRDAECQIGYKPIDSAYWDPLFGNFSASIFTGEEPQNDLAGPQVYETSLSAGKYQVSVRTKLRDISTGLEGSLNSQVFEIDVLAGSTVDLTADVGGFGVVQGKMQAREGESSQYLLLVPGSEFPEEAIPSVSDFYSVLSLTQGRASQVQVYNSEYEFNCLPDGTYTIGAFAKRELDGAIFPRGFCTVQISDGTTQKVDF